jgi:hypothetical protein
MLRDVVHVIALDDYRLRLRFDDGVEGEIDVSATVPFKGVFAPFVDPAFFRQVSVNEALGVVCWPNGADLDSDVLYAAITGQPLPTSVAAPQL